MEFERITFLVSLDHLHHSHVLWLFSPTLPSCSQQHDLRASLEGHSWLGCCSDTSLFCAFDLDVCIYGFRHSSQSSLFPSSTFMNSAPLFSLLLSPVPGQRDGCCVMSVIVLILPFSQHFNSFMLLPNFYWLIIWILYDYISSSSALPIMGLALSCWLVQYLLLLWQYLVNNNRIVGLVQGAQITENPPPTKTSCSFLCSKFCAQLPTSTAITQKFNWHVTFNYVVPACLRVSTSRWFFTYAHAHPTVQQREY